MLASRLGSFDDLRVADLFAGSGALGFEALSRGAAEAVFVEQDAATVTVIKRNAERLRAPAKVIQVSATVLPSSAPFDLVFADPPYAPASGSAAVEAVLAAGWLAAGGWMSVETAREDQVDAYELAIEVERVVGRARLTLLRWP